MKAAGGLRSGFPWLALLLAILSHRFFSSLRYGLAYLLHVKLRFGCKGHNPMLKMLCA